MTDYTTNGVLIGLHRHKVGQYRILERVTCGLLALLVLVFLVSVLQTGDGGYQEVPVHSTRLPTLSGILGQSSSPSSFPRGFVGKVRIVPIGRDPILSPKGLPVCVPNTAPTPGGTQFLDAGNLAEAPGSFSDHTDYRLPEPAPLWTFTSRGVPAGIHPEDVDLPVAARAPHAMLSNPAWPRGVWLVDDTAVVEGWLTFHTYGLLSFELSSESHPRLGFAQAVKNAVYQGSCIPARDRQGERVTVRCRYRCLFLQDGQPSVSVGQLITARVKPK